MADYGQVVEGCCAEAVQRRGQELPAAHTSDVGQVRVQCGGCVHPPLLVGTQLFVFVAV